MEGVENMSILTKPYAGWTTLYVGTRDLAYLSFEKDVPVILGNAILATLDVMQNKELTDENIPFFAPLYNRRNGVILANLFGNICAIDSAPVGSDSYVSHLLFKPEIGAREAVIRMAYGLANDIQRNLYDWVIWDVSLPDKVEEPELYEQASADREKMLRDLAVSLRTQAEAVENQKGH